MLTVITDLTERRALESGVQRAQRLEALGQVAGGVAHDVRNVLCAVITNADLLREDTAPGPVREQLDDIVNAAMSGAALARQLVAFSRDAEFRPAAVAIDPLVARAAPLLRRLAGRAIDLQLDLASDHAEVWADPASSSKCS